MIDRDIVIDLRKVTATTGPFKTQMLSVEKKVYASLKDAGAEEKERAQVKGKVNVMRVDINEEEFDGETVAFVNDLEKEIYKIVRKRNKVYLYLSDSTTKKQNESHVLFIPLGSDSLITADGYTFKVKGA